MDPRAPLVLCLVMLTTVAGCLGDNDQPEILGTFYPATFLLQEIAGDLVSVGQLTPAGVEPHDWEPAVQDIARLQEATLLVAISPRLERYLDRFLDNLGDEAPAVLYTARAHHELESDDHDDETGADPDAAAGDDPHAGHGHEGDTSDAHDYLGALDEVPRDPHTWVSPSRFAAEALLLGRVLGEFYPDHAETFAARSTALAERLNQLAIGFDARVVACAVPHVITQHDSFGHLGHDHNFTIHPVAGLSPEAEPDAATVRRIIDTMREHDIKTVFVDAETRPAVMASIAAETGATVRTLSPLEFRTAAERSAQDDYFDIMGRNMDALVEAMECT